MASNTDLDWKGDILTKLRQRNKNQTLPYIGLIQAQNKLFDIATKLKSENIHLQLESEKLKEENLSLQIKAEAGGGGGGEKSQVLEQKLYKLQEELTELHRKRGENVQQIIDLNAALQEKEKELQLKEAKLYDTEANIVAVQEAQRHLEQTIVELHATNQMLKDEHQALQMAFSALEEKYRACQEDNRELVERWMSHRSKEADKMNAENDVFLKKRQVMLQKELADAASEPVVDLTKDFMQGQKVPVCISASIPSRMQAEIDAHESDVNAIQWSLSGHIFATGGADRRIKLWEIVNGSCVQKGILLGSNAGITALEFDLEDSLILGSSNDFASRVWGLNDHRLRHTLTGHSGKVLRARFFSDINKVVSGSHDRTLKIWDLHSKACVKTIFAGSSCNDLVTLHGNNIISGHFDKRVRFWDTRSDISANEILLQGRLTSLDLSPDRGSLLCCTRDDSMKIIDLRMNQVSTTLCANGFHVGSDWSRAVFSPDGSYCAAGSNDGTIFVWNISNSKVEKVLKGHSHAVNGVSWNPVGSSILSCERSRKIIYWSDY